MSHFFVPPWRIMLVVIIFIHTVNVVNTAEFDCNDGLKQCNCLSNSCNKICSNPNQCDDFSFYCSNTSISCSLLCVDPNSCQNVNIQLQSTFSSVECIGNNSCRNSLFECESLNTCQLQTYSSSSFVDSEFLCHGTKCNIQLLEDDEYGFLSYNVNEGEISKCSIMDDLISCDHVNGNDATCSGTLCDGTTIAATNRDSNHNNNYFVEFTSEDVNIWIVTITIILSMSISCILYYFCSNLCHDKLKGISSNVSKSRGVPSRNGDEVDELNVVVNGQRADSQNVNDTNSDSTHFESSFWLTLITTLFNEEDKTQGIDCGIILIPHKKPIEAILNSTFRGCEQCKVPVTEQFLKHYGKTAQRVNSYILIQGGYIYGHDIYQQELKRNNKNQTIYQVANANDYIIIDSQKKETQKHNNSYYRIFVNHVRTKSVDQFCTALKSYGIDINLTNDDTTTTWKVRDSLELSSSFLHNSAEAIAATNLAESIKHLQDQRNDRNHPEMVGATIVVIPYNKSLADYKIFLRQYLSVSIEVSDNSLLCIFSHDSVLHDGAIFVRGNRIIAVKAFFRITGQYKNKPSIGHGTRHASAQEFSKHSKLHKPITFVLSEEDGLIRSCINGEIKKVNHLNIPRLIVEHHYYTKTHLNFLDKINTIKEAEQSKSTEIIAEEAEDDGTEYTEEGRLSLNNFIKKRMNLPKKSSKFKNGEHSSSISSGNKQQIGSASSSTKETNTTSSISVEIESVPSNIDENK